jgi:hypothetical protein
MSVACRLPLVSLLAPSWATPGAFCAPYVSLLSIRSNRVVGGRALPTLGWGLRGGPV